MTNLYATARELIADLKAKKISALNRDELVDISGEVDAKERALACHASQRNWLIKHHGVDDYLRAMRDWAIKQGKAAGVPFAEGFRQHLGHSYPQDNVIGLLLGVQ